MKLRITRGQILSILCFVFLCVLAVRNIAYFTPFLFREETTKRADFPNYYMGALLLRENKQNLYNIQTQTNAYHDITGIDINKFHEYTGYEYVGKVYEFFLPFRALPPLALLLLPLSYLPYGQAFQVFLAINTCLLTLALYLLTTTLRSTGSKIIIYLGALAYEATFIALAQGQPTIIMLLITVLIYLFIEKGKLLNAGLISGLYFLKTQYIVIVPLIWVITKMNKDYIKGFVITAIGFCALSLLLVGPEVLFQYPKFVAYTETAKYFSPPSKLVSVQGYLASLVNLETIPHTIIGTSIILYVIIGYTLYKRTRDYSLEYLFSMALLFGLLFSLHVFGQDLVVVYVAIVLLARGSQKNLLAIISLLFMLMAPFIKMSPVSFIMYIVPGLLMLVGFKPNERNNS